MAQESTCDLSGIEVESFDGLLIDYARSREIHVLVRGLRVYSDFEFEFQMALTNRKLAPEVETLFSDAAGCSQLCKFFPGSRSGCLRRGCEPTRATAGPGGGEKSDGAVTHRDHRPVSARRG